MARRGISTEDRKVKPAVKAGVSLFVLFHFAAVVSAPFSLASRGTTVAYRDGRVETSPVADHWFNGLKGYTTFMFLNHGYSFFAPEPGPSHLVEYKATKNQQETQQGIFPDLQQQWPRLLYHRYFMLSESLNAHFVPDVPATQRDEQWQAARGFYLRLRSSVANHFANKLNVDNVELTRILHDVPPLDVFRQGQRLDDPTLLRRLSDQTGAVIEPGAGQGS